MLDAELIAADAACIVLTETVISLDALISNPLLPMIAVLTVTLDVLSMLKEHD